MKDEPARPHGEVAALKERCRMLEKALRDARELIRARDSELERAKAEIAKMKEEREREEEVKRKTEAVLQRKASKRTLIAAPRNGQEIATPVSKGIWIDAEARAREQSLDVFMTKYDEWSGADVCEAVQDLNSEILQFAASASELCISSARAKNPIARPPQAVQDTATRLGPSFVRVLAVRDNSRDPILLQFALQSCLSSCIARFFSSFCPGLSTKYDALLCQIHEHMQASLPQATSSRWRALTHRHIRALYRNVEEHALNELATTLLRWTADALATAGCAPGAAQALAGPGGPRTKLRRIVLAVGKLAQVTREEILSANFEVGVVPPGATFEETEMCSAADAPGVSASGKVLCTTELGLRCSSRKAVLRVPGTGAVNGQGNNTATQRVDDDLEQTLLLKPKVVLESLVAALDR